MIGSGSKIRSGKVVHDLPQENPHPPRLEPPFESETRKHNLLQVHTLLSFHWHPNCGYDYPTPSIVLVRLSLGKDQLGAVRGPAQSQRANDKHKELKRTQARKKIGSSFLGNRPEKLHCFPKQSAKIKAKICGTYFFFILGH